jgi:hypothetical protein
MFVYDEPERGLHLQLHKSSITSDVDAIILRCLFLASIKFKVYDDYQKTFGCPIGPDLYVQDFVKAKIDNIQLILDRIMYINDPQIEMIILRGNANSSKINHLLCTVRRDRIRDELQTANQKCQMAIEAILSAQIDDPFAWKQAHLPIGKAELAISIVDDHLDAAYISSRLGTAGLVNKLHGRKDAYAEPTDNLSAEFERLRQRINLGDLNALDKILKFIPEAPVAGI